MYLYFFETLDAGVYSIEILKDILSFMKSESTQFKLFKIHKILRYSIEILNYVTKSGVDIQPGF